jgi:hypothetical protein
LVANKPLPIPEILSAIGLPSTRLRQGSWQARIGARQPTEAAAQELGHQGELKRIDAIGLQQIGAELGATQEHQTLKPSCSKRIEPLRPGWCQRQPTIKALIHRLRSQQPTLKRLIKETPGAREVGGSADHDSSRLLIPPLEAALLKQLRVADQAGALMGPQGSSTDQAGITPGKRLLQSATITLSPQLGGTPVRLSQAAIDADGQHQPYEGA